MANPYQYMNPIGAALVGVPDAYRAEMQKKRDIEMQQVADSEAARKRNEEAQFREDVKGSFKEGYGSIGMDELAQKRLQAGDIRGLEYGQRAEDIGQQEDERKRSAVNTTTRALANSLLNGTPAEQQQYTQEFDSHFGTKSDIMESQDPDTGERKWTITQVDKEGKRHDHEVDAKQMRQWALTGIAPDKQQSADIKYQDLERKQQEGQQKLGQGERKLEQGDRSLDLKQKALESKARIDGMNAELKRAGVGGQLNDNAKQYIAANELETNKRYSIPRSKAGIDALNAIGDEFAKRGMQSPGAVGAEYKALSKTISDTVNDQSKFKVFLDMANKNAGVLKDLAKKIPDLGSRLLNKPARALEGLMSAPDYRAYLAVLQAVKSEYTRITNVNMRFAIKAKEIEKMDQAMPEDMTFAEIERVLDVLRKEGNNRDLAMNKELEDLRSKVGSLGKGKGRKYGQQEPAQTPSGYTKGQGKASSDVNDFF